MFRQVMIFFVVGSALLAARPALAQSFLERLESVIGGQAAAPAASAREPGYLGLTVDEAEQSGVVVLEVEAGGPAARAGLQKGDRLVSIEDRKLANLDGMAAALEPFFSGDTLKISFIREGKEQATQLTLMAPPPATPALERLERQIEEVAPPPDPDSAPSRGAFLGVQTAPITDALRERYGLAVASGIVIEGVTRGSPADRAGLPVGAAIVAVDGEPIDSAEQLTAYLRSRSAGSEVEISYYRGRQLIRTRVRLAAAAPAERPLRLGENRDPLLAEPPGPELPPTGGRPIESPFSGERPAGRLLNRVLEGVQQIEAPPPASNARELERHVEQLEAYIDRLERRIAELEAQLERRDR